MLTGFTQEGCSPIGPRRIITGYTGNTITALDERLALEVLKEDIGDVLACAICGASPVIFTLVC